MPNALSTAEAAKKHAEVLKNIAKKYEISPKTLARVSDVRRIHENRRSLDERAFYPAHDKRKESPEYAKVHKQMVVEQDLPCLVCGVRYSTLADATQNPYGARALETHHHVIEWALANAIDVAKFNDRILPALARRHPDKPDYRRPFTQADLTAWVDHSPENLWVLCDVHHRHKWIGIHAITHPIWGPQDLYSDAFMIEVNKQLGTAGGKKSASSKKPSSKRSTGKKVAPAKKTPKTLVKSGRR